MGELKRGPRGLPAVARIRADRARRGPQWTMRAGAVAAGAVVVGFVAHTVVSSHELGADKDALLAKQRAVATTLGARWFPLRDRLESEILDAAKEAPPLDRVTPEARTESFRTQPGIYLRMRVADATSVDSIRRVAADAKKDAFAACLLREPNDAAARGQADAGAFAEQPWNLGRAYSATRILSDDWSREVRDAEDEMRLRVFVEQYDMAVREDVPVAIDVVSRARFFLLVLDEDVPLTGQPVGAPVTEEALELVPHPARVRLLELPSGKELFALRRSGDALVIPAGERPVTDPETRDAMQRQANNCSLATQVQAALASR